MAQSLKSGYGIEVAQRIGTQIKHAWSAFDVAGFIELVSPGYNELELMGRARHIATAMRSSLPDDFEHAADIVEASLGPVNQSTEGSGFSSFDYAPHGYWVVAHALDLADETKIQAKPSAQVFDRAMRFQHALTQRFTAEFSVRAFIEADTKRALDHLKRWVHDPSPHVRRLVSEGLRPRLPWAGQLKVFMDNHEPVLKLLNDLRDDPSDYVRRSVANHLNDIGKDAPEVLLDTARAWSASGAPALRRALIKHALRSLIKQGHSDALAIVGYQATPGVRVSRATFVPERLKIGESVAIEVELDAPAGSGCLIDLRVSYRKANGSYNPKVFKWAERIAPATGVIRLKRRLSFEQRTTRTHHAGPHHFELLVNGTALGLGSIILEPESIDPGKKP
jgi:3-methyladenine DNA glycosylase AlkC